MMIPIRIYLPFLYITFFKENSLRGMALSVSYVITFRFMIVKLSSRLDNDDRPGIIRKLTLLIVAK